MASLHAWGGGELPEKRGQLYAATVDLLLKFWGSARFEIDEAGKAINAPRSVCVWIDSFKDDPKKVLKELQKLAFEAHKDQESLKGTADIPLSKFKDALELASYSPDIPIGRVVEYLTDRAGLLISHGNQMYTFPHRSFQEYLAAQYLADEHFPIKVVELFQQDPERWREVVLLTTNDDSYRAWGLAEALCSLPPDDDHATENKAWV